MLLTKKTPKSHRRSVFSKARLFVEPLETRNLMSGSGWPGLVNPVQGNVTSGTLSGFADLGDLSLTRQAGAVGTIGNGTGSTAEVDWYRFTLDNPADVTLTTLDRQGHSGLVSVLSLYNSDSFDFNDWYNPTGHRLLAQSDGSSNGGDAQIERQLAEGTYYVAVSGSGNRYFHPNLANSGLPGSTGNYGLLITSTDLPLEVDGNPAVMAVDASPFVVRVDITEDPADTTLFNDQTVQLTDSNGTPITMDWTRFNYAPDPYELMFTPANALAPGHYTLSIAGAADGGPFANPMTLPFDVAQGEGAANDTPATSHQLGDITSSGIVQVPGTIGDDTYYDATAGDPALAPGNDVDMYHFQITGDGRYSVILDVSAGRIGSPLNPGVSLFQYVPSDQANPYHFVAGNDDTLNTTQATDGTPVLLDDAALFVNLAAGDYYVAVSSTGNVPLGVQGLVPGNGTIFDPTISHSGTGGTSTGDYVLGVHVQPSGPPPHVVSSTPTQDQTLSVTPTQLVVQFDEPINLNQLVYQTWQQTGQYDVSAVEITGPGGPYFPRLDSFNTETNVATFRMLDGLAPGDYVLHLSGPKGITDFAGNQLVANDFSGDYVIQFAVSGTPRGTNSNKLLWTDTEPNNTLQSPQNLGVLFPHEAEAGITFTRNFANTPLTGSSDTADYYEFQVTESQDYLFTLNGTSLPSGIQLALTDTDGHTVPASIRSNHTVIEANLSPGTYILRVGSFGSGSFSHASYNVRLTILNLQINPQPLTVGPAPALTIRLATSTPPAPAPTPPQVTLPDGPVELPGEGGSTTNNTTGGGDTGGTTTNQGGDGTGGGPAIIHVNQPTTGSSDVIASLMAGPIGGVRSSADSIQLEPTNAVLAQRLNLAAVEQVMQLIVLTQPASASATSTDEIANPGPQSQVFSPLQPSTTSTGLETYVRDFMQTWEQVRDIVFSMGNWLPTPSTPGAATDTPPVDSSLSEEQNVPEKEEE